MVVSYVRDIRCRNPFAHVIICTACDEDLTVPANDSVEIETDFKYLCEKYIIEVYSSSSFQLEVFMWSGDKWVRHPSCVNPLAPFETVDESGARIYYVKQIIGDVLGRTKLRIVNKSSTDISLRVKWLCKIP